MLKANSRDKGFKKTRLAIAEEIAKRKGRPNDYLRTRPPCPKGLEYIWPLYVDIVKGCDNIRYSDLLAYESVTGLKLMKLEADLIIDIDLMRRKNAN